jgi:hypothetical protein
MIWIGLMWLNIGTSGGLLGTRYWTFGFHKMLGSSWVAAQFAAPQEGLSSVSKVAKPEGSTLVKPNLVTGPNLGMFLHASDYHNLTNWYLFFKSPFHLVLELPSGRFPRDFSKFNIIIKSSYTITLHRIITLSWYHSMGVGHVLACSGLIHSVVSSKVLSFPSSTRCVFFLVVSEVCFFQILSTSWM